MCDDLVPVGDTRVCREYPIEIMFCKTCLTAHQRFQVPKQDLFPSTYHYRSRFTADVINGMRSITESCEQRYGTLKGRKVLDIGCNDGSLLDLFRGKGAITIGVEPTGAVADAEGKGHSLYNDFLSSESARKVVQSHGQPDFITFTNVFAHIENLKEVLASLLILISPTTVLVIENHYLGSVLAGNQFDTFYHEHPRTYSFRSFQYMASSLGSSIQHVEFPSRYGGNIRVFIGGVRQQVVTKLDEVHARENTFSEQFENMARNVETWRKRKSAELAELAGHYGPLKAKAFPGRAAILVKLLGLNEKIVDAVYEKPGSLKIGHYLPGTRIPIRSDNELFSQGSLDQPLLNMAWHISDEIRTYMREHGYSDQIVDILSQVDFSEI
jgi:SAM-dependent methyltransferase